MLFRVDRLYVRLDEPVPGLDHLRAVNSVEFAWLNTDLHAERLDLTPLSVFQFAPFQRPVWTPAAVPLRTVRGLISSYHRWQAGDRAYWCDGPPLSADDLLILSQVEAVLAAADALDRRVYFMANGS